MLQVKGVKKLCGKKGKDRFRSLYISPSRRRQLKDMKGAWLRYKIEWKHEPHKKLIQVCIGIVLIIIMAFTFKSVNMLIGILSTQVVVKYETIKLSMDKIPKQIYATSKTGNKLPSQPCPGSNWNKNEYDDAKLKEFLSKEFADKLNIEESLRDIVEQADLWRYAVLNEYGGLYMDADCRCQQSPDLWLHSFGLDNITKENENAYILDNLLANMKMPIEDVIGYNNVIDIDMIVGIEFYGADLNPDPLFALEFVQWTFASQPNNVILQNVIESVLGNIKTMNDTKENIDRRTGPKGFTKSILQFVEKHHLYQEEVKLFDWQQIEKCGQLIPMMYNDKVLWILVLPYRAFGYPGYHPNEIKSVPSTQKLIKHNFAGSWKTASMT